MTSEAVRCVMCGATSERIWELTQQVNDQLAALDRQGELVDQLTKQVGDLQKDNRHLQDQNTKLGIENERLGQPLEE